MRAVVFSAQSDGCDPFVHKPGILARAHRAAEIKTAGKDIPIGCPATAQEPCGKTAASVSGNLELHRSSCFLLNNESGVPNIGARHEITDLELHEVAAAQLAVDGKVEPRAIAQPLL